MKEPTNEDKIIDKAIDKAINKAFNLGKDAVLDDWENWIFDSMRNGYDYITFETMLMTIKNWRNDK